MHVSVWVITTKTRDELETARRNPEELNRFMSDAAQEARSITAHFDESLGERNEHVSPPFRFDHATPGTHWGNGIGEDPQVWVNTCQEAARRPIEDLPRIVVSPEGYAASAPTIEEKPEIRRILNQWPDNVAVSMDWHY